jgi:hypothetical protein
VFCAVIAVIAVVPCTPARANALRSAWIPAPPPESEPAIDRQIGMRLGRDTAAKDRTVPRTPGRARRADAAVYGPRAVSSDKCADCEHGHHRGMTT